MSQCRDDFSANFSAMDRTDAQNTTTSAHVRNLCFVFLDGRKVFYNYAYLVSVTLHIDQHSENRLEICFTSQIITLKGYRLELLFQLLFSHIPQCIPQTDKRYLSGDCSGYSVTEITVKAV